MNAYIATTEHITITVRPVYLDGQSNPIEHKYVFAYYVRIENKGVEDVQLLRRHWLINHGGFRVEEVEGEGVVGKQPVIPPGGAHEYNSFSILETLEGWMEGTYLMRRGESEYFRVTIPKFTLRAAAN